MINTTVSDTVLTTVTKDVTVEGGFPVFDWGKSDFRFNVPIYVSDDGNMANYWNPTNGIVATEVTAGKFAIGDKNSKYYPPYIVNSGTSGNWTYRKWSNGVAECWGKVSFTVSFQSSNGIYYDSENGRATFPFTFKSIPVVSGSTDWHYANWLNIWPSTTNYSRCGWIYFQTTENGNNTERSVYLYAIGQADASSVSVVMSKNTLSLTTGEASTITASISPTGTAYNTVLWASSDNAVATVSNGKITAKSPGNAIIAAYTEDKAYRGECVVVVEPVTVSVTKITLDKSAITIEVGKTATLSATILPTDATNKKITWSSSSISIATVDNGVITAVKAGTATITAKTADGNYTASCVVEVAAAETSSATITVAKNFLTYPYVHLTAVLPKDEDLVSGNIIIVTIEGSNAANMKNGSSRGVGFLYGSVNGGVNDAEYTQEFGTDCVNNQTVDGTSVTITKTIAIDETVSDDYIKVPILLYGTVPYSFTVNSFEILVNGKHKVPTALGAFFKSDKEGITVTGDVPYIPET